MAQKASPSSTRHLDLDKAKAARIAKLEADGALPTVTLGGKVRELAPELDLRVAIFEAAGAVEQMVTFLFPNDDPLEVLEHGITLDDLRAIVSDLYGVDVGEADASA